MNSACWYQFPCRYVTLFWKLLISPSTSLDIYKQWIFGYCHQDCDAKRLRLVMKTTDVTTNQRLSLHFNCNILWKSENTTVDSIGANKETKLSQSEDVTPLADQRIKTQILKKIIPRFYKPAEYTVDIRSYDNLYHSICPNKTKGDIVSCLVYRRVDKNTDEGTCCRCENAWTTAVVVVVVVVIQIVIVVFVLVK